MTVALFSDGTPLASKLMKMSHIRKIAVCLLLLITANIVVAGSSISVLFVGNSLTQANDLPKVFKQFASESPLHVEIDAHSITPGGAFFYDHWKRGEALKMLRELHPQFLVLQGQSTEPLSAPQSFVYYAGLFKAEADRFNAKTILFSTWARPAGDPYYREPSSGGSPAKMQRRLNTAYASLARDTGAILAPIGLAMNRAQHDVPSMKLLDGTQHPSIAGTYRAAAVLFRAMFTSPTVGSAYYGELPKETAVALQQLADKTSFE